ncbi:MAG TPA: DUF1707 domain-containing protein [Acidimicrobiales bacterium]|nr:DUF1707 domain-containing protein [Acidimicrobiales bacterium]
MSFQHHDPDLRVSQAERDEVVAVLARHYADGRLTLGEYEERVDAALGARTGRDFEPLLADLPVERAPAPTAFEAGWRSPAPPPASDGDPRPVRTPGQSRAPQPLGRRTAWGPGLSQRAVAVVAVIVLAAVAGPWALWLLWPALALTRGHAFRPGSGRGFGPCGGHGGHALPGSRTDDSAIQRL